MPRETLASLRAPPAGQQAVSDVRPDRSLPLDLPAAGRSRPAPRLDRQGDPQRRDPGAARGRLACAANEPGELVHRGALVGMGYWNDPERPPNATNRCPPTRPGRDAGLVLPEIAVFSGDTVRSDEEGFLYFIGRRDEMMKTSGYRVSPTEVEEVLYATRLVGECVAFGVDHPTLGQAIQVIATPAAGSALDAPRCSPNAAAACRPTWCRRRRPCIPARCRATPTARSTARRWLASSSPGRAMRPRQRCKGAPVKPANAASPRHAAMDQFPVPTANSSSAACR
jgi:hypothetical protein